jgi:CRP-like cAMP-binding protein
VNQQRSSWPRTAAPGEVIYSEGFASDGLVYVIADGKVEISAVCDDSKVVLGTLSKGEFFGEAALLPGEPRGNTARALSFCQLTVVQASLIEQELERTSPLLRHMVRTLIRRVKKRDDLLATYTHADFLPGVLSYAHVLALMAGGAESGGDRWDGNGRRGRGEEVSVPLSEVVKKCRAIAGHSRLHVMAMLKRMEKLNLVTLEGGRAEHLAGAASRLASQDSASSRQQVTFDPTRITERAQQVADRELDVALASELELIDLDDLEALIGVEKSVILNKLSHAEIAEDVFAFRKTRVLDYVEEKGVSYFSRRNARPGGEITSIDDLAFVDQRTLFEAVSAFDTYDLAKLLASLGGQPVAERLLSVMTETRKNEVSWVMRRDIKIDPIEVGEIEQRFVETVKAIKAAAVNAASSTQPGA